MESAYQKCNLKGIQGVRTSLIKFTLENAPENVTIIAYKTLCRHLLEYAAEVWDPCNKN